MKNTILKTIVAAAISIAAIHSLAAQMPAKPVSNGNNIVKVASGNPDFSTLVKALAAAESALALARADAFGVLQKSANRLSTTATAKLAQQSAAAAGPRCSVS